MGDGVADDTAAINRAASDGDRCGQLCGSTTVTGALVYFPVCFSPLYSQLLSLLSHGAINTDQSASPPYTYKTGRNIPDQDTYNTVSFSLPPRVNFFFFVPQDVPVPHLPGEKKLADDKTPVGITILNLLAIQITSLLLRGTPASLESP